MLITQPFCHSNNTSVSPHSRFRLISGDLSALSMTAVYALDIICVPKELTYRDISIANDDSGNDKDDSADSSDHAGVEKKQEVEEAALQLKYNAIAARSCW